MDCSAYVSAVWGVSRYTTDSIWAVSHFISKDELRAGDAMNLTIGRDPSRKGHIRLFEAWANPERTLMWVYEETPPRAVHRVIAYDSNYQPIRRNGLSSVGPALLIPAPVSAPERAAPSNGNRSNAQRTPAPTARPAARTTARPTAAPTRTPPPGSYLLDKSTGVVIGGARSGNSPPPMLVIGTLAPTARPTATLRPAVTAAPPVAKPTPKPTPPPTF